MEELSITQGREGMQRLLGEEGAELTEGFLENTSPVFREFLTRCFGVYDRQALDLKTRSAITIAVLIALGRGQELSGHLRAGLNIGLTEEQIHEIIMQVAVYAGAPVAIEAYLIAAKVFPK